MGFSDSVVDERQVYRSERYLVEPEAYYLSLIAYSGARFCGNFPHSGHPRHQQ